MSAALLEQMNARLARIEGLLEARQAGQSKPVPVAVGLQELRELLAVGDWRPCIRTVKQWTRTHRATLVRVTQRPVSYTRESVAQTIAELGKKKTATLGGRKL